MRVHLALLACLLVPLLSFAKAADPCATTLLPREIQQLLASKYSDWRAKTTADLEEDDRRLWLKANPYACPGLAIGRFQRQDQMSYAVLLVPRSEPTQEYKVVVISKAMGSDDYSVRVLDHANGASYSGLVISKVPPGKYSDFDDMSSIRSKLDAINVEWIEKGAVLYYYSRGSYHKLQTSD
jgi:hypothetical protein